MCYTGPSCDVMYKLFFVTRDNQNPNNVFASSGNDFNVQFMLFWSFVLFSLNVFALATTKAVLVGGFDCPCSK